jgi:excisionase family DNA binding protein
MYTQLVEGTDHTNRNPTLELLTVDEAASLFKIDSSKLYRMMRSGEIPAIKFGRARRIRKVDLEKFINDQVNG